MSEAQFVILGRETNGRPEVLVTLSRYGTLQFPTLDDLGDASVGESQLLDMPHQDVGNDPVFYTATGRNGFVSNTFQWREANSNVLRGLSRRHRVAYTRAIQQFARKYESFYNLAEKEGYRRYVFV